MKFADLHLHTLFSDGTSTPEELIDEAEKAGLSCVAIVDHDTVNGIEPAKARAQLKDIEVLPGIELTCEYNGAEIHLLGYLIDYQNRELLEKIDFLKQNRIERIYKIVDRLKKMGVELKAQDVFDVAKGGIVGRLHIARAMLGAGIANSIAEAFQKFIGDKCPAYICGFKLAPAEAIKLIKGSGGIPVLAHPYTLGKDELVGEFIEYGLMGLEVYYPEHTPTMINFYLSLTRKYNLLVTGGSDYHGYVKPEVKIGAVKIPYDLVEELKEAKQKIHL